MSKLKKSKKTRVKVTALVEKGRACLKSEQNVSAAFKDVVSELLEVVVVLSGRLGINSDNSSKPPSQDPNRDRKVRKAKGRKRKPGGQKGHKGSCLQQVKVPTHVIEIEVDQSSLPPGKYRNAGFESRQVFDVEVSIVVTEYRAEILVNESGVEFVADFPEEVLAEYTG